MILSARAGGGEAEVPGHEVTGIATVDGCQLFFIVTTAPQDPAPLATRSDFLDKMCAVFADEFTPEFHARTRRQLILSEVARYREHVGHCEVFCSNFDDFRCSLLYVRLTFERPLPYTDFAILTSGDRYRDLVSIGNAPLATAIGLDRVALQGDRRSFLFSQLRAVSPALPDSESFVGDMSEPFRRQLNQLLLRSDTDPRDLRPDNHVDKLDGIANFYGTVDFCSTHHLIQFYQRPVRSLTSSEPIDADHRACWWLALMDVLHLQAFVIREALERVNGLNDLDDRDVVFEINEIDAVIRSIRRYWSLDELTHPMSRVVVMVLRQRLGLEERLATLRDRLQTTENIVLRGINEEQNRHNAVLNIILLMIAAVQFVPVIYAGLQQLRNPQGTFDYLGWSGSTGIGFLLPICILLLARRRSQRLLARLRRVRGHAPL